MLNLSQKALSSNGVLADNLDVNVVEFGQKPAVTDNNKIIRICAPKGNQTSPKEE